MNHDSARRAVVERPTLPTSDPGAGRTRLGFVRFLGHLGRWTAVSVALVGAMLGGLLVMPSGVHAIGATVATPTEPTEPPPPSVPPLVPVPTGCDPPDQPYIVFLGTVVDGDYRTKRFRIDQIRAGRTEPFADGDQIDVRFGNDEQYLEIGETYLVGAGVEPALGILYSVVVPAPEDFGGDQVIGISETDVECTEVASGIRTIYPDGSEVEGGVLNPVRGRWLEVATAVALPILAALGIIFVLALLGNGSRAAARMVTNRDDVA